jgi:ABC-2 type transport system permease protein
MRMQKIWVVFRKDWIEIRRNWQVIMPILIVPLIFAIVLPTVLTTAISQAGPQSENQTINQTLAGLPPSVHAEVSGMTDSQAMAYLVLLYLFAPFFLIIPIMASSVIASDSFAGEKERKTIEALLATPISDSELLMGKILVAFIPAMLVTFMAFGIYFAIINASFVSMIGRIILPNLSWLLLMFLLTPAIAMAGIGLTVIISARVKGFREAQQISALMVLPVLFVFFGQASGLLFLGPLNIILMTAALALLDFLIFRLGISMFRREEILAKL